MKLSVPVIQALDRAGAVLVVLLFLEFPLLPPPEGSSPPVTLGVHTPRPWDHRACTPGLQGPDVSGPRFWGRWSLYVGSHSILSFSWELLVSPSVHGGQDCPLSDLCFLHRFAISVGDFTSTLCSLRFRCHVFIWVSESHQHPGIAMRSSTLGRRSTAVFFLARPIQVRVSRVCGRVAH